MAPSTEPLLSADRHRHNTDIAHGLPASTLQPQGPSKRGAVAAQKERQTRQRQTEQPRQQQWRMEQEAAALQQQLQQQQLENTRLQQRLSYLQCGLQALDEEQQRAVDDQPRRRHQAHNPSCGQAPGRDLHGMNLASMGPQRMLLTPGGSLLDTAGRHGPAAGRCGSGVSVWALPEPGHWDAEWQARVEAFTPLDFVMLHRQFLMESGMLIPKAQFALQASGSSAPDYQRLLGFMDRLFCFNRFAARCALPALMSRSGYDMETLMPVQKHSREALFGILQQHPDGKHLIGIFRQYGRAAQKLAEEAVELGRRYKQITGHAYGPEQEHMQSARSAQHTGSLNQMYGQATTYDCLQDDSAHMSGMGGISTTLYGRAGVQSAGTSGCSGQAGAALGFAQPAVHSQWQWQPAPPLALSPASHVPATSPWQPSLLAQSPASPLAVSPASPWAASTLAGSPTSSAPTASPATSHGHHQVHHERFLLESVQSLQREDEVAAALQANLRKQKTAIQQFLLAMWQGQRERHAADYAHLCLATYPLAPDLLDFVDAAVQCGGDVGDWQG